MKIRTDFVTNSSSSSYVLEVVFENDEGTTATLSLEPGEDCGMFNRFPFPDKKMGDISFSNQSISAMKDIAALIDLICSAGEYEGFPLSGYECDDLVFVIAGELEHYENEEKLAAVIKMAGGSVQKTISKHTNYLINNDTNPDSNENKKASELGVRVITEIEFIATFDTEKYFEILYDGKEVYYGRSLSEAAPADVNMLKWDCEKQGITLENLRTIVIRDMADGYGDSAKYIELDVAEFYAFKKRYLAAESNGEKAKIADEMFAFIKSEPELESYDNDDLGVPKRTICAWYDGDAYLKEAIELYLTGKMTHPWMGMSAYECIIDVTGKNITYKDKIYLTWEWIERCLNGNSEDEYDGYSDDEDEDW